jgi:flavin-binding protein dodecin
VAVQKAVELTGSGASVEDAVAEAIDRAGLTLEGITGFDIKKLSGVVDGARVTYQVRLRVWFVLRERMHG